MNVTENAFLHCLNVQVTANTAIHKYFLFVCVGFEKKSYTYRVSYLWRFWQRRGMRIHCLIVEVLENTAVYIQIDLLPGLRQHFDFAKRETG